MGERLHELRVWKLFKKKKQKKTVAEIPQNNRIFQLLINLFIWGKKKSQ